MPTTHVILRNGATAVATINAVGLPHATLAIRDRGEVVFAAYAAHITFAILCSVVDPGTAQTLTAFLSENGV